MSSLTDQIAELCRLILCFQQRVAPLRQTLFTCSSITDDCIWGYMFGADSLEINWKNIYNFLHKHKRPIDKKACQLLCHRCSSYRNGQLVQQDLWILFKPLTIKHADSILKARKQKKLSSNYPQISYQAKDILLDILEQTLTYEVVADKMKQNIFKAMEKIGGEQFQLTKIQPKYLQAYLVNSASQIRIVDCQIIMKHILGHKLNFPKHFYSFFHPSCSLSPKCNPMPQILKKEKEQSVLGAKFFQNSSKIWNYGKNYNKHRSPFYLI